MGRLPAHKDVDSSRYCYGKSIYPRVVLLHHIVLHHLESWPKIVDLGIDLQYTIAKAFSEQLDLELMKITKLSVLL